MTRVALRMCAYSSSVAAAEGPSRVTVSAAERLGEPQDLDAPVAVALRHAHQARGLHVHHDPLGIERVREAPAGAHQLLGLRIRTDRHQHALTGRGAPRTGPAGSARAAASTRSATRRSAISRSAIRFCLRKKRSVAAVA